MQLVTRYNAIDVLKMFMAFLVIGIHVGAIFEIEYPLFLNFILGTAVPFFFICSGFFIQNKIIKTGNSFYTLKDSCKKYLKLYILWHLVYFPMALKHLWFNERNFWGDMLYCLHQFLFVGEIIYSWPLWYLHGLIVAIIFIYVLQKAKFSLMKIWIISIIMMLIGYYIQIVTASASTNGNILYYICQSSVDLWGTADRNGPFRGFALVTTGMMIRQYHHCIRYEYVLGIICVTISWLLFYYSLPFHLIFSGGGLFIIASSILLKNSPVYSACRTHSTFIYFIHMYFVVIAHMLLKKNISNIREVYLTWFVIFFITWLFSLAFCKIKEKKSFHWLNHFIC